MKAFLSLPTLVLLLCSWSLPKLNTPAAKAGKNIKAPTLRTVTFSNPADTSDIPAPILHALRGGYSLRTVVIDPGHGGHDPGCHGVHSKEKHVCLAVGKYLAKAIEQNFPDVRVIMTRDKDVFIPLHERAAIATRNKADLFISIHCNAIVNASKTMGTETYVLGLHATEANLEVAKRENEAILYEDNYKETYGYDPNSPEAHILFSMFQNAFLEQSLSFADKVQKHTNAEANRKNRGVKQAGFIVLKYATMPSVLVETGFLTNVTEENFLRTKAGQKAMANSLLLAFADYKAEMEGGAIAKVTKLEIEEAEEEASPEEAPAVASSTTSEQALALEAKPVAVKQQQTAEPWSNTGRADQPSENSEPRKPAKAPVNQPQESRPPLPVPAVPEKKANDTQGKAKITPINPVSENEGPAQGSTQKRSEIQYRVQLSASPKLLDTTIGKWTKVDYLIQVMEEGGLYKYQVVNFATPEAAEAAKQELRSLGFNDAFVVQYQDGKRVK